MNEREKELLRMLRLVEQKAIDGTDGHLTIMRFTGGWKIMLGTPEMTFELSGEDCEITGGGRGEVDKLASFKSLEAALENFVYREERGQIGQAKDDSAGQRNQGSETRI